MWPEGRPLVRRVSQAIPFPEFQSVISTRKVTHPPYFGKANRMPKPRPRQTPLNQRILSAVCHERVEEVESVDTAELLDSRIR